MIAAQELCVAQLKFVLQSRNYYSRAKMKCDDQSFRYNRLVNQSERNDRILPPGVEMTDKLTLLQDLFQYNAHYCQKMFGNQWKAADEKFCSICNFGKVKISS